ncbi:hypothetical protein LJC20_03595 [Eubacteriales bacterium OttesenSCG-928-M02]|nr:hypothetical protein [Eubacteriales bacterium OttesenSCG-928-M02]
MIDKKLRAHYKRLLYKGRGPLARALDFVALRIILFLLGWVFFATRLTSVWQGAVMSFIFLAVLSVAVEWYKGKKMARFLVEKREALCHEYQMDQLVVLDPNVFLKVVGRLMNHLGYRILGMREGALLVEYGGDRSMMFPVQSHRNYEITSQDLLDMVRILKANGLTEMLLVSTSRLSEEASAFQKKIPNLSLSILRQESLLEEAQKMGLLPGIPEMEAALLKELEEQEMSLGRLRMEALYSGKTRAYLLCGGIILVASAFTGFNLYYPLVAALCFFLAYLSYRNNRAEKKGGL